MCLVSVICRCSASSKRYSFLVFGFSLALSGISNIANYISIFKPLMALLPRPFPFSSITYTNEYRVSRLEVLPKLFVFVQNFSAA